MVLHTIDNWAFGLSGCLFALLVQFQTFKSEGNIKLLNVALNKLSINNISALTNCAWMSLLDRNVLRPFLKGSIWRSPNLLANIVEMLLPYSLCLKVGPQLCDPESCSRVRIDLLFWNA